MAYALIGLVLLALLSQLPGWWASWTLRRHNTPANLPGGGAEFAAWLIRQKNLPVSLERGESDHYDPTTRTVRLSPAFYSTPSLAAVAVAAHEVAHAQQHAEQHPGFMQRIQLIQRAQWLQKLSAGALLAAPLLIPLTHGFVAPMLAFTAGFIAQGVPLLIHLQTLQVEWDASFNRALPWLQESGHFTPAQLRIMRQVLRACALTYVAQSVGSLFNVLRWLQQGRR
ncbi:hypothetical protein SAMN05443662_0159 [Sulfurivirga caldicuralii]|uniref:Neutral zinc metallopeptidase n=1 Tax=Sulfurivirga caldicuralii TaxID=364032 RepID=A0A1N6DHV0_9GAMM|nr:zinc metallopeptidase [Sulfurivirga caldicuralii]SIN70360.1 hypothetical protein SAMN05443662_0159 [Sulfurivirga caldicuralii]